MASHQALYWMLNITEIIYWVKWRPKSVVRFPTNILEIGNYFWICIYIWWIASVSPCLYSKVKPGFEPWARHTWEESCHLTTEPSFSLSLWDHDKVLAFWLLWYLLKLQIFSFYPLLIWITFLPNLFSFIIFMFFRTQARSHQWNWSTRYLRSRLMVALRSVKGVGAKAESCKLCLCCTFSNW